MTTQRQFTRQPGTQQLALLTPLEGTGPSSPTPTVDHPSAGRPPRLSGRVASSQLTLVRADRLPPQLRIDSRTRTIGRAGIAELRRILADAGAGSAAGTAA
jgi:hypothetical protein